MTVLFFHLNFRCSLLIKQDLHYEASVKIKPKQLFNKIEEVNQKGEATFSYPLFKDYPDRSADEDLPAVAAPPPGIKIYEASQAKQHLEPAKHEVDLHIERLAADWRHMTPLAKLGLQMDTFEKYLDLAIVHHFPSMVVIHGIGSGRLRDEIHEVLRYKRNVKSFINQYDPRYGYGATEIFFQYS